MLTQRASYADRLLYDCKRLWGQPYMAPVFAMLLHQWLLLNKDAGGGIQRQKHVNVLVSGLSSTCCSALLQLLCTKHNLVRSVHLIPPCPLIMPITMSEPCRADCRSSPALLGRCALQHRALHHPLLLSCDRRRVQPGPHTARQLACPVQGWPALCGGTIHAILWRCSGKCRGLA